MTDALGAMTGLIPITMAGGIVLGFQKEMFPAGPTGRGYASKPYRSRKRSTRRRRSNNSRVSGMHGNFSNVLG